jgi:hypothetical protein
LRSSIIVLVVFVETLGSAYASTLIVILVAFTAEPSTVTVYASGGRAVSS